MSATVQDTHIIFMSLGLWALMFAGAFWIVHEARKEWCLWKWGQDAVRLRDKELARVTLMFIDRANDPSPSTGDPADKILQEWASETNAVLEMHWLNESE